MPRYDFQCQKCKETFEAVMFFGSQSIPQCPKCGRKDVEKIITPPLGIHFKGSGFYKTDAKTSVSKPEEQKKEIKDKEGEKSTKDPPTPKDTKETSTTPSKTEAPKV